MVIFANYFWQKKILVRISRMQVFFVCNVIIIVVLKKFIVMCTLYLYMTFNLLFIKIRKTILWRKLQVYLSKENTGKILDLDMLYSILSLQLIFKSERGK